LLSSFIIVAMTIVITDVKKAATLSSTDHHQRLERIATIFKNLRIASFVQLVFGGAVVLAFGFSPKLVRKSAYFLPLIWGLTSLMFIAHGASSIATTRYSLVPSDADERGKIRILDDKQQQVIVPSRASLRIVVTPKSTRGRRKKWKAAGLTRVDEGNLLSSTDDFAGPRSE